MVKKKDHRLSLASALWTDDWWCPDGSIAVNPPLLTSGSATTKNDLRTTVVVGKQALLSCLKYKHDHDNIKEDPIDPPFTDIWDWETIGHTHQLKMSLPMLPKNHRLSFAAELRLQNCGHRPSLRQLPDCL